MRRGPFLVTGIMIVSAFVLLRDIQAAELPKVLVIGTGGTIASGVDPASG